MNPDRWTFRWLLLVPFLVGAFIGHRWKMVLPVERSARIPTGKAKYLPTCKEPIKVARFLSTEQQPICDSHIVKVASRSVEERPALVVVPSYLDPLHGLMSLQL
jgi:hypothetical protein